MAYSDTKFVTFFVHFKCDTSDGNNFKYRTLGMFHASGQCNDKYYNYITYISPTFRGNVKILECREELYSQLMGTSEKQK